MHKGTFREALTWLEIHGQAPEAVAEWRALVEHAPRIRPSRAPRTKRDRPRRRRRRAEAGAVRPRRHHRNSARSLAGGQAAPQAVAACRRSAVRRVATTTVNGDAPALNDRRRYERYPCVRSNSRMNCTSASTPSSGNAL